MKRIATMLFAARASGRIAGRQARVERSVHPKTAIVFAMVILLVPAIAFATGETEGGSDGATIEFASWLVQSQEIYDDLIVAPFEAENPAISVNVTLSPWGEYWQKIQTQYASGDTPDVYDMSLAYLYNFVENGMVENLQTRAETDLALDAFLETAITPGRYPGNDGDLYSLHTMWGPGVLFYNKDMFDAAGLEYPDETWDYDRLLEVALELTLDTDGDGRADQWGFLSQPGYYLHFNVIRAYGGEVLNADRTASELDSPEVIEATKLLVDLIHEYDASPSPVMMEGLGNAFQTGRVAMTINGAFNIQTFRTITEFDWDIAMVPSGPVRRSTYVGGNPSKVISSLSDHRDESWALIRWIMQNQTPENILLPGALPSSRPAFEGWLESQRGLKPENMQVVLDSAEYGYGLYASLGWAEWYAAYNNEMDLAFLGNISAEEALRNAHREINSILDAQ